MIDWNKLGEAIRYSRWNMISPWWLTCGLSPLRVICNLTFLAPEVRDGRWMRSCTAIAWVMRSSHACPSAHLTFWLLVTCHRFSLLRSLGTFVCWGYSYAHWRIKPAHTSITGKIFSCSAINHVFCRWRKAVLYSTDRSNVTKVTIGMTC